MAADEFDDDRWWVFSINTSPLSGEKSIGRIFSSNRRLGLSFHLRKTVHPAATSATTDATTMMIIKVVLFSPAIFSGSSLLAALDAEAEDEAVTRTTVELREAVTTVVWVTDDRDDGADELAMSAEDAAADGEGEAAAASGSADDG